MERFWCVLVFADVLLLGLPWEAWFIEVIALFQIVACLDIGCWQCRLGCLCQVQRGVLVALQLRPAPNRNCSLGLIWSLAGALPFLALPSETSFPA
jgi:hypothetical protein